MNYQQRRAEAYRKALEGFRIDYSKVHFPSGKWVRKDRPPKNPNLRWTKEQAEQLVEYVRQGLLSHEIAALMGKSPKSIQKAYVRFGLPRLSNICPRYGTDNPAWKGGIHVSHNGYIYVRKPNHPFANLHGYVPQHRLVVEQRLGRFLLPSEAVHHIDGNHANNDIANLEVFSSNGDHLRATLRGIRHNVSAENRKKLSRLSKARWASGMFEGRLKGITHHPRQTTPSVASIRFS